MSKIFGEDIIELNLNRIFIICGLFLNYKITRQSLDISVIFSETKIEFIYENNLWLLFYTERLGINALLWKDGRTVVVESTVAVLLALPYVCVLTNRIFNFFIIIAYK